MRHLAPVPGLPAFVALLLVGSLCATPAAPEDTVDSLMGLQAATVSALFDVPVTTDMHAAVETFFDDESRCEDRSGCVEAIDTPYEAYALATYLSLYWNDTLRSPIRAQDLARHRMLHAPDAEEHDSGVERLQAEERGDLLRRNAASFRESFWKSHLETNRRHIASALERFERLRGTATTDNVQQPQGSSARASDSPEQASAAAPAPDSPGQAYGSTQRGDARTLMVLGAGSCADIPLEELARRYEVILVDIDGPSMLAARSRLPESLQPRVALEVRDLSGGVVLHHSQAFERLIEESRDSGEAMARLAAFMQSATVPTPHLEGTHRVDALVSSMLVSQIPFYLVMQIVESLGDPNVGLEGQGWSVEFEAAVRKYSSRLEDAHAEALRDFCVRTGGLVYYASDLVLERSALELGRSDEVLPSLPAPRIQSLWHQGRPVSDLTEIFRSDPRLRIVDDPAPWLWEHFHPLLQESWSPIRTESLCAPLRGDSCWTAGPGRFKVGRRFIVDAVAFTRR